MRFIENSLGGAGHASGIRDIQISCTTMQMARISYDFSCFAYSIMRKDLEA
jgi:hypothetical protein